MNVEKARAAIDAYERADQGVTDAQTSLTSWTAERDRAVDDLNGAIAERPPSKITFTGDITTATTKLGGQG